MPGDFSPHQAFGAAKHHSHLIARTMMNGRSKPFSLRAQACRVSHEANVPAGEPDRVNMPR